MTVGHHRFEFLAVKEIRLRALLAEEEPVASLRADRAALVQERAERRDARAGADHDDRRLAVFRQTKTVRDLHKHWHRAVCAISEKRRANAFAFAPEALVAHCGDGEMHLIGERFEAR